MYVARSDRDRRKCLFLTNRSMEGKHVVIFDTETSGLDFIKDRIIQFAYEQYRVVSGDLVLEKSGSLYIKPPFELSEKNMSIHGITNDFLSDKPDENQVFPEIKELFADCPAVVGHNVTFDLKMLLNMYRRHKEKLKIMFYADTLQMARDLFPKKDVENYTLQKITETFGISGGIDFHKADSDVRATARLLVFCQQEYEDQKDYVPDGKKKRIHLYSSYYWKGYKREQQGIYIKTSENYIRGSGSIYFSTFSKCWCSSKYDVKDYDLSQLERDLLHQLGLRTMEEVGKLTEKRFSNLKQGRAQ